MGNRIYGCDDCLAVCPWNRFAQATPHDKLRARDDLTAPRLAELAALDDAGFRTMFSGSPIKRIGRNRFVRNVLIAIGNSGDPALHAVAARLTARCRRGRRRGRQVGVRATGERSHGMKTRTETDSLGSIEIDAERYWGPQTERARRLFRIGTEVFPPGLIRAVGLQKQAAAEANQQLGELPREIAEPIIAAAREIADNRMDTEFPLPVWQTGSGTQTNMTANEVIANRANELVGGDRGAREPVHPNDHVNRGQSSNDSFPTVMHIAAVEAVERLIPALATLRHALAVRAQEWQDIVKVGRTHMMDAVPVTLGQEFAAWARQVELGIARLRDAMPRLLLLAQGGTAVGTGLNCHPDVRPGVLRTARSAHRSGIRTQSQQVRGHGRA